MPAAPYVRLHDTDNVAIATSTLSAGIYLPDLAQRMEEDIDADCGGILEHSETPAERGGEDL